MTPRWEVRLCDWQGFDLGVSIPFWFKRTALAFMERHNRLSRMLQQQVAAYVWDTRREVEYP